MLNLAIDSLFDIQKIYREATIVTWTMMKINF